LILIAASFRIFRYLPIVIGTTEAEPFLWIHDKGQIVLFTIVSLGAVAQAIRGFIFGEWSAHAAEKPKVPSWGSVALGLYIAKLRDSAVNTTVWFLAAGFALGYLIYNRFVLGSPRPTLSYEGAGIAILLVILSPLLKVPPTRYNLPNQREHPQDTYRLPAGLLVALMYVALLGSLTAAAYIGRPLEAKKMAVVFYVDSAVDTKELPVALNEMTRQVLLVYDASQFEFKTVRQDSRPVFEGLVPENSVQRSVVHVYLRKRGPNDLVYATALREDGYATIYMDPFWAPPDALVHEITHILLGHLDVPRHTWLAPFDMFTQVSLDLVTDLRIFFLHRRLIRAS